MKTVTRKNKWLGCLLIAVALALGIVGAMSMSSIQTMILTASSGDGSIITLAESWPQMVMPVLGCLATGAALLFVGGLYVLSGKITFIER
ncbi:MAG: hypothetical protein ACNJA3_28775 (plasmid) [Pseudomonas rhizophila]|uniref:hypothetical protein n=1 Tax=Pseudomonas rhizophila TaxID=2045200 RepID=UPI003F6CC60A